MACSCDWDYSPLAARSTPSLILILNSKVCCQLANAVAGKHSAHHMHHYTIFIYVWSKIELFLIYLYCSIVYYLVILYFSLSFYRKVSQCLQVGINSSRHMGNHGSSR